MMFAENDLLIEKKKRDYAWSMHKFHFHNRFEIYYIASGERKILCDKVVFELRTGDALLLRPNELHKSTGTQSQEKYGVEFSKNYLNYYFTENMQEHLLHCFSYGLIHLNETERIRFEQTYLNMHNEYVHGKCCALRLVELLTILDDAGERSKIEHRETSRIGHNICERSSLILSYLEENYRNIKSIDDIANGVHLNKNYLCRLFKRETGMTIMDYLQHYRIQHACEMIASTSNKISDVAVCCGFENTSHFIKLFKSLIGCTPGAFRKLCKISSQ